MTIHLLCAMVAGLSLLIRAPTARGTELPGYEETLQGVTYVDMYAPPYRTQRPLLCGPGRLFPEGMEMVFRNPDTNTEFHVVFSKGVAAPQGNGLTNALTLHGRFGTIQSAPVGKDPQGPDRLGKRVPDGYRYFVVSRWEICNSPAAQPETKPRLALAAKTLELEAATGKSFRKQKEWQEWGFGEKRTVNIRADFIEAAQGILPQRWSVERRVWSGSLGCTMVLRDGARPSSPDVGEGNAVLCILPPETDEQPGTADGRGKTYTPILKAANGTAHLWADAGNWKTIESDLAKALVGEPMPVAPFLVDVTDTAGVRQHATIRANWLQLRRFNVGLESFEKECRSALGRRPVAELRKVTINMSGHRDMLLGDVAEIAVEPSPPAGQPGMTDRLNELNADPPRNIDVAIHCLAAAAPAEDGQTNTPLRLAVDLVDGSHIIGTPCIETVPVETSYARMNVPLSQIQTLQIGDDHETGSILLRNGDKLKGVITLVPIKLTTVFGPVSIGIEHIKQLRVTRMGLALPDDLRRGLALYYTFDALQAGVVRDASDCKNHSAAVRGVTVDGKASFQGSTTISVPNSASLNPEKSITLSVWINATTHQNKGIVMKGPLTDSQGSYSLVLNPDSHGGNGLFRLNGGIEDGQGQVSTRESMDGYMGKWTHLVGTYADGEQKIYVNGKLSGTQPYQQPIQNDANPLIVGGYYSPGYLYQGDLDDLMIFNRALSGAEIEQLYKSR